ncbi:MAG: ATP-binding protein [bacterium]
MGKEIFDSITSKLATQVPLFAKSLVTQGLKHVGTDPYSVTPSLMMKALNEYILPRIHSYGKGAEPMDLIGEGIIRTTPMGDILEISPVILSMLNLHGLGKSNHDGIRDSLIKQGILYPSGEAWNPRRKCISQKVEIQSPNRRTIEVLITPALNQAQEVVEFSYILRDITLSEGLFQEILDLYENLEKKIHEGSEELRETEHLGTLLVQELDRQHVLNLITEKAAHLVGAETVFLIMISPDAKSYTYPAAYGIDAEQIIGGELPMEIGPCGQVLKNKKPLIINNLQKDGQMVAGGALKRPVKAAIYLPIFQKGDIIGGIAAIGKKNAPAFSEQDFKLLNIFANYASIAIENASLYSNINKTKEFLETIFNGVGVGIVVLSPELRILSANRAIRSMSGHKEEDLIGSHCFERFHGSPSPCADCPAVRTFSKGQAAQKDSTSRNTKGETVHLELNTYPLFNKSGEVIQVIETSKDITQLKKLEEERIVKTEQLRKLSFELEQKVRERTLELDLKNQALEKANLTLRDLDCKKTEFLNIVAHDLRTPLTSIISYADLLLRYKNESEQTREEFLNIIKTEGFRLGNLVNDYLDLSKIESGNMNFRKGLLDLNELIKHCLSLFEGQSKIMKIQLQQEFDHKERFMIMGDRDKLLQVFINILSNAFKFTPRGGTITIRQQMVSPEDSLSLGLPEYAAPLTLKQQMVMIRLTDTGPGIAEEHHKGIFEKFYHIQDVPNQIPSGTGLGLSISKNIIELHEGRIWVESSIGSGATFIIILPASSKTSQVPISG